MVMYKLVCLEVLRLLYVLRHGWPESQLPYNRQFLYLIWDTGLPLRFSKGLLSFSKLVTSPCLVCFYEPAGLYLLQARRD